MPTVPGEPPHAKPGISRSATLGRSACITIITLATLFYFFWTTVASFDAIPRINPKEHREGDHYNLLSRGFLKGQLHLDADVPAELLAAPNPYDPKSRGPVSVLHDASLFEGKYYIYFGPAPVVTLFLPFTALTGRDFPIAYGVLVFTSGAFLALGATFLFVQRRHFPCARLWSISAGLVALGGASMLVALLRRPHIWEIAGAAGLCYASLAFYCLVRAIHSPAPSRWTAIGGLALGLAIASRPTWLLTSVLFGLPLLFPARESTGSAPPFGWRALLAATATCTTVVACLLAYNYARFDSPFEFGQKYQLSSVIEGNVRHFSPSYIAANFRIYFLSALQWRSTFPFHDGIIVPSLPSGHGGYEYSFGVFRNLPFALFAFVVPFVLFRAGRNLEDQRKRATFAVVAGAAFLSSGFLLFFFGNCVRYMADFSPWIMLLAAWAVLALDSRCHSSFARRALRFLAPTLSVVSALIAAAGVMPLYHFVERPPDAYLPIARLLNVPTFLIRELRWPGHHPQEIIVTFPADRSPRQEPLLSVTRGQQLAAELFVDYLGDDKLRLGFRAAGTQQGIYSPLLAPLPGTRDKLHISLGSRADYNGHTARLRIHLNDWPLWVAPAITAEAFPGTIHVGTSPATPARFTGQVHENRSIGLSDFASRRLGGARVRVLLAREMAGRSFPLMTSGRTGAGDLLFLRVETNGRATLGYDHWADRLRYSSELPTAFERTYIFEFWIPPATPAIDAGGHRELLVKLDGDIVWRQPVPWFPTTPEDLYVGANPIGGSTCEPVLINGIIEQTQILFPTPAR